MESERFYLIVKVQGFLDCRKASRSVHVVVFTVYRDFLEMT
jgi:hypothetical protein